jgi:hypothetical protein
MINLAYLVLWVVSRIPLVALIVCSHQTPDMFHLHFIRVMLTCCDHFQAYHPK